MQTRQDVQMIGDLQVVLLYTWDQILYHGMQESKPQSPDLVQRLSINYWQMLRLKLCEFKPCLMSWECRSLKRQYYGVIILEQCILLQIRYFILGLNILKWIITLFEKSCSEVVEH
jgi:hypothetical protein